VLGAKLEHGLVEYLIDYGSLGIMAGIFFWLYLQNKKELVAARNRGYEEAEKVRERFQVVIEKYDQEKTEMQNERINNLLELKNAINDLKDINTQQNILIVESQNELRDIKTELKILLRGD